MLDMLLSMAALLQEIPIQTSRHYSGQEALFTIPGLLISVNALLVEIRCQRMEALCTMRARQLSPIVHFLETRLYTVMMFSRRVVELARGDLATTFRPAQTLYPAHAPCNHNRRPQLNLSRLRL